MAKAASADTKTQVMRVLIAELRDHLRLESGENTPPQSIEPVGEALPQSRRKRYWRGIIPVIILI
jgi:hypothetical protein